MKNLKAKLLAAGMTAAMVVSMSAPVWAATQGTYASSTAAGATVTKNYVAASGVTKPAQTFSFTVTPATDSEISVANASTERDSSYTTVAGPALKDGTDARTVTTEFTKDATTTSKVSTNTLFKDTDFPATGTDKVAPGAYAYIVKETASTYSGAGTLTTDTTEYYVEVLVNYDADSSSNKVAGVTAQKITRSDSSVTLGSKVSTIEFNNKYTAYGNEDPNDDDNNTDGDTSKALTVTKNVTGSAKGSTGDFTFTLTLTKDTTAYGDGYVNDGLEVTSDVAVTKDGSSITAGSDMGYGTFTFTLKDGDTANFKIPAGTTYSVEEAADSKTGFTVTDSGNTSGTISKTSSAAVTITNNKDTNPLTGIVNNYGGLLMIVAIAAAGIVVLSIRRRREA